MTEGVDMFRDRWFSTGPVLGLLLLLAGCVQPGPSPEEVAKAPPIPTDISEQATSSRLAQAISSNCSDEFGYDVTHEEVVKASLARKYGREGKMPSWVSEATIQRTVQQFDAVHLPEYMKRHRITKGSSSEWCLAGKAEVAEGSAIGEYLVAR